LFCQNILSALPTQGDRVMKMVLKAFWPSICKYRWLLVTLLTFMVMTVLAKAVYPFLLRDLLQGLVNNSDSDVTQALWLIVGSFVFANIVNICFDRAHIFFEAQIMRDLDQQTFDVIQNQSMRFFEDSYAGSLVTSARRFRNSFESLTDTLMFRFGPGFTMIVLTLIVFAHEHLWLALAFGIWIAVFCAAATWFAVLRMKRDVVVAQKDSAVGGIFADSFSNEATVKSYAKEGDEQKRFDEVTEDCYQHRKNTWLFGMALKRFQIFIMSIFEMVLVLVLVQGWRDGTVTAGDFVFFQTYVLLLMYHMRDIGNELHRVFRNLAEAKEMAEIYARKPEVEDAITARPLNVEDGEIEFHAVNFSYKDRGIIDCEVRERHDVNDFTLHVEPGESVAIVGHSGAGKSTLVKLLLRYFDLNSGYIRIDRQDIANVTQVSLRQQIAIVPQRPDLFHRSLRDNIAFARPDATEEEIIAAAKRAHAWEFIERLPDGLNTLVGERGVKLSGGEQQRIALARAFLADAQILIFDEPTSALDTKTELKIEAATVDLRKGRTCIVIAHRLSTIRRADRIIVMENGSIVEEGSHQDLLDQDGVYADLYNHQSGGYIND